ncbi:MAG: HlyC/CorC family transporter [Bacteroidetes bacterium]|nr:HlyC/CorC family transporter [Bacteroidota bacterium]MBT6686493.1 HlyC/CorC family transporter [Bacteroidota bacterium]MBT7143333.1 HlyC/CorC family transporter [Bacteroidota bacterium]MBT7491549.1 HlyC/CorC family transporter [Bacteroidota bacterium]
MEQILISLISLVFSAFFSGMEIAFVSSNKLRIEVEKKQGFLTSGIISVFTKNQGQYIATMLVGNNIALVIFAMQMAKILEPTILKFVSVEIVVLSVQTIISTIIILFTAEFLPKTVFRANANIALNVFSIPVAFFYYLFYPIAKFTIWLSYLSLGFLKASIKNNTEKVAFEKVDLDDFIGKGNIKSEENEELQQEIKYFQNALDFSDVKLRECMIPRTEIVALEKNESIELLIQTFIETGLSKILIYKDNIDNIVGYFHSSELFKNPKSIKSKIIQLPIVPESMPANKLLELFMKDRKNIAVVVDEFGGTSGVITTEDIIEEIFGEIEDEHDKIELEDKKINENEYIFSGRLEIDFINEKFNLNIKASEDYNTIAGYILFHYESIPNLHDKIKIRNFEFEILDIGNSRIERVKMLKK